MTRTRISRSRDRSAPTPSARDQALAWLTRQVQWERTLAGLRTAPAAPVPSRKAA